VIAARLFAVFVFLVSFVSLVVPCQLSAQTITQRGFVETSSVFFPQKTPNDDQRLVVDVLAREDVFVKPTSWVQFAAGIDARANTHEQVERSWRLDLRDRRPLKPALSIRRLNATLTRGPVTVDVGKQFIRWGRADIVTPTDHFAPRDFLNVIDTEFLGVTGTRAVVQWGAETLEAVWIPYFTPSRTPLLNQRWTAVPPGAESLTLSDASGAPPRGSQSGIRVGRMGDRYEFSASYFNGFNHLPDIVVRPGSAPFEVEIIKAYPEVQSYGFDAAVPTRWLTVKGEVAYSTSSSPSSDQYVIYVLQLERQTGEWLIVGGYAGEVVTEHRAQFTFAPDRGLTRSLVARASYTIDANRSAAVEGAVRQTGHGAYAKAEYSQARGQHWRATITGAAIRGQSDDFLGQYRRNSHLTFALRYSF
jgi:hypothetical protein